MCRSIDLLYTDASPTRLPQCTSISFRVVFHPREFWDPSISPPTTWRHLSPISRCSTHPPILPTHATHTIQVRLDNREHQPFSPSHNRNLGRFHGSIRNSGVCHDFNSAEITIITTTATTMATGTMTTAATAYHPLTFYQLCFSPARRRTNRLHSE